MGLKKLFVLIRRVFPTVLLALFAILALPIFAVEVCHDYAIYRVLLFERVPPYAVRDINAVSLGGIQNWLENAAKYKRIYGPWQVLDDRPLPIAVKPGDVILKAVGNLGHAGFVNDQLSIDHYLQVYDGPKRQRQDPKSYIPTRCPDASTPATAVGCGGWTVDRDTGQRVPVCCGLLAGDSWPVFLHRQGDWKGANFEIWREIDSDQDRVPDWRDRCPNTAANERMLIDANGCGPSQRDDDQDGVSNASDACPNTPVSERKLVDARGCGPSQQDDDQDGVTNDKDQCPATPAGEAVDGLGCSLRQGIKLNIDADDPVTPGKPARFAVRLDPRSEAALRNFVGGVSYEWTVNGRPAGATNPSVSVDIAPNYAQDKVVATVHLILSTASRRSDIAQATRTVQVRRVQAQCGGKQWSLTVPNTKPEKKYTGPTLANCQYLITADGAVSDWGDKKDGVDAVWCYAEWRCGKAGQPWQQLRIDGKGMMDLAGGRLDYNAGHRYQIRVKGTGKPFEFYCADAQGSWQDNKGSFNVNVTEIAPQ